MRLMIGMGAVLALLLPGAPASAFWFNPDRVTAPWCLAHSDQSGMVECNFASFRQCQETRLGLGGSCQPNPAFQPAPERRRAKRRQQ